MIDLNSVSATANKMKETAITVKETAAKESPVANAISNIENSNIEKLKSQEENLLSNKFNDLAPKSPLYENNHSRLVWVERFGKLLKGIDGFESTKMKTLSNNINSARGSFAELARAYRWAEAGNKVEAIGKNVETKIGKTDIDIIGETAKGEKCWIENKDVKNISLTDDFKTKIDKMSSSLKEGVTDYAGNQYKFDKVIFVNNKDISSNAIEYAKSKGVEIKENMDGNKFKFYIRNL